MTSHAQKAIIATDLKMLQSRADAQGSSCCAGQKQARTYAVTSTLALGTGVDSVAICICFSKTCTVLHKNLAMSLKTFQKRRISGLNAD